LNSPFLNSHLLPQKTDTDLDLIPSSHPIPASVPDPVPLIINNSKLLKAAATHIHLVPRLPFVTTTTKHRGVGVVTNGKRLGLK
jgi:hypothetical protein